MQSLSNDKWHFFHRTRTKKFTTCMEIAKTLIYQSKMDKLECNWGNQASRLQTILQSYSHLDSMVLAQKQKYRPMEQNRKPVWSILTVASWPSYRFLKRQVRWSGIPISFKNFPQFIVIHIVKGFGIVNKAEIDVFLELSCSFDNPADVGNLISGSSAFSKTSLNIWKFTVHVLLKPGLENFEHYFTSVWEKCYCVVVWAFFTIAFLWDWNENWPFPDLWQLLSFPNLLAYWVQHFHSIIFQDLK